MQIVARDLNPEPPVYPHDSKRMGCHHHDGTDLSKLAGIELLSQFRGSLGLRPFSDFACGDDTFCLPCIAGFYFQRSSWTKCCRRPNGCRAGELARSGEVVEKIGRVAFRIVPELTLYVSN